jgi:hypothetical protein
MEEAFDVSLAAISNTGATGCSGVLPQQCYRL